MVPHVIPPIDGKESHTTNIATSPIESSPHAGSVLSEDDEETTYKPLQSTYVDNPEHFKDTLTMIDDDPSGIDTVYYGGDLLNGDVPLALQCPC